MLKIILKFLHPNGKSHCNDPKVIETEAPRNDMIAVGLKTQDTQLNPKQNPMPKKTQDTQQNPKQKPMPKKTQDTQLNPKQNPMPKNTQDTQLNPKQKSMPKKTQDTQLNPKQSPIPKGTMKPRYKFKRIKKGGKVQKIQSPGVYKIKFEPSHKIADS